MVAMTAGDKPGPSEGGAGEVVGVAIRPLVWPPIGALLVTVLTRVRIGVVNELGVGVLVCRVPSLSFGVEFGVSVEVVLAGVLMGSLFETGLPGGLDELNIPIVGM